MSELEWREDGRASVGPLEGQVSYWTAVAPVPDGSVKYHIRWAAEDRFVMRMSD